MKTTIKFLLLLAVAMAVMDEEAQVSSCLSGGDLRLQLLLCLCRLVKKTPRSRSVTRWYAAHKGTRET